MRLDLRPAIAATFACALLVTGCGSRGEEPAGFAESQATAASEPSSPAAEPPADASDAAPSEAELEVASNPPEGEDAEIFEAYVAYWEATVAAGMVPDPEHDRLLRLSTDPQRDRVVSTLEEMRRAGERFAGTFRISPSVVAVTGPVAQLEDCLDGRDSYHIDSSGAEVADSRGSLSAVSVQLVAEADGWVVGDIQRTSERECPDG